MSPAYEARWEAQLAAYQEWESAEFVECTEEVEAERLQRIRGIEEEIKEIEKTMSKRGQLRGLKIALAKFRKDLQKAVTEEEKASCTRHTNHVLSLIELFGPRREKEQV